MSYGMKGFLPGFCSAFLLFACLGACVKKDVVQVSDSAEHRAGAVKAESLAEHMEHHLTMATDLRDAVLNGDLADAKEQGRRLVEHPEALGLPDPWRPPTEAMRAAAQKSWDAQDLKVAAIGAAEVATACQNCHEMIDISPAFAEPPAMIEGEEIARHMMRHRWAVERMWEGMISRSQERWNQGAAVFDEEPATDLLRPGMAELMPRITALAQQVHELGRKAADVPVNQGGPVMAELLGACADCHKVMNWEPEE